MPRPSALANGCGRCFFVAWLLGWSGIVLVFDVISAGAAFYQGRAALYPTTEGTVTRCAVKTEPGDDGPTHRLDIAYDYEVGGRRHTGTRYSYAEIGTNTRAWHRIRDELRPGTRVTVAYDPDDPAESLLRPGFTGFHLAMVWFLTPFNVVMIGGWIGATRARRPAFDPDDPRIVVATDTGWRVRLPALGGAARFAITLLAVTFCGIFVWGFGFGFNPPVWLVGGGYLAAVAAALWVAARHVPPWLEVDEVARVLRLPAGIEPAEVPFASIRDVMATHEEWKDSDDETQHRYYCDLIRVDAPPIRFATHRDTVWADALIAWLRERLGIAPPALETPPA